MQHNNHDRNNNFTCHNNSNHDTTRGMATATTQSDNSTGNTTRGATTPPLVFVFAIHRFVLREAVWSMVLLCWDMDKFEIKKQDRSDLSIDHCIRLYIGVI